MIQRGDLIVVGQQHHHRADAPGRGEGGLAGSAGESGRIGQGDHPVIVLDLDLDYDGDDTSDWYEDDEE